jgi:hypothetical protein
MVFLRLSWTTVARPNCLTNRDTAGEFRKTRQINSCDSLSHNGASDYQEQISGDITSLLRFRPITPSNVRFSVMIVIRTLPQHCAAAHPACTGKRIAKALAYKIARVWRPRWITSARAIRAKAGASTP